MITSAIEFVRLRVSHVPDDYNRANHDEADLSVWMDVYRDYPEFRESIASNSTSPQAMLELLATEDDWRIRSEVARRIDANQDLLRRLAQDPDEGVRARVCWNPSTPRDALENLAATEWFEPNLERLKERLAELGERQER